MPSSETSAIVAMALDLETVTADLRWSTTVGQVSRDFCAHKHIVRVAKQAPSFTENGDVSFKQ